MPVLLEPCFKAGNFTKNQSNMESKEKPLKQSFDFTHIFICFRRLCSTFSGAKPTSQWQTKLQQQQNWQARGKLAFIAPDNRQSTNFNWYFNDNKQNLILTSFVGTRIFELKELSSHSQLTFEDQTHKGMDSSDLVRRLSGLSLPVNQAPQWLTGLIASETSEVDEQGRLKQAQWQSPEGRIWQIQYQQYKCKTACGFPVAWSFHRPVLRSKY